MIPVIPTSDQNPAFKMRGLVW